MPYRWLVGLVTVTVLAVALAFALPAHEGSAGSLDQEAEHEQTVKIGVTSCGVERWSIKTGTDAGASSVNQKSLVPANIFHLRTLPAPSSPPVTSRVKPVETSVYSVSALLLRYKYEADSDVHLVIADTGGRTFAKEEEVYLPLLDARLSPAEADGLFESMGHAAHETKHERTLT